MVDERTSTGLQSSAWELFCNTRAANCQRQAHLHPDPAVRDEWLRMAAEWREAATIDPTEWAVRKAVRRSKR